MKLLIASDIHGSAFWCRKLLEAYRDSGAEKLVLLGDLLYHGPRNDLPEEYAPKEVIALLNAYSREIIAVRGNCEAEVDQMVLDFLCLHESAVIFADGVTMRLTHGHHYNLDAPLPMAAGEVMLYGHTHVPLDETRDGVRFLNPGSVSIPKGGSAHGYLFFEDGEFSYRTL